jgi:hypothetical protein
VRSSREYANLASILLQLADVVPPARNHAVVKNGQGAGSIASKVIAGTVVNNDDTFFLMEEANHHAYMLTNIRLARSFAGRKVRVRGMLKSPHVITVESIEEIY